MGTNTTMVFRAGLLASENIPSVRKTCQENRPFPHTVIQDAIQDDFLRQARNEIDSNLQFEFEENHVYRIQRSTHLANISNPDEYAPDLLPNLIGPRNALYSFEFREWISIMTGVGPLSGTKSSMAVNLYTPGGHLLVHDDCNPKSKNRRVSFILYLTDPDSPWKSEWGGDLRLYACERKTNANGGSVAVTLPMWTKHIRPCFNQLIFFTSRFQNIVVPEFRNLPTYTHHMKAPRSDWPSRNIRATIGAENSMASPDCS